MATSFVRYTGNGSTTDYAVTFAYRSTDDVAITIDGVATTAYTWNAAGTIVTFTSAPASDTSIEIRRTTSQTTRLTDYAAGSVLTENDLDTDSTQGFYMSQEAIDDANDVISLDAADFQWDASSKRLKNVADPTAAQDAVTKNYLTSTYLSTATIANINTLADVADELALLGTSDAITDMNTLGTSDIVSDMNTLATSDIVADLNTLATSDIVTDMNVLATADVVADMNTLGTADVVADMNTLGTADVVSDMNTLATSDVVSDMNTLATSANVTAMGLLGNADTVTDMGLLGTSDCVADMAILATTDVVADMNTLGTADVVTDMNVLATSDVVTDMNVLATADVVTDMNVLATADVVTDMNTLGTADVVTDMNTLGTSANVTAMSTCADNIAGVNSFADRYRVASSDPTGSLDEGDLVYNSTSNVVKFYNGSAWVAITSSTMNDFTLTGDSGSNQTIADGNTLDIEGGDGIDTVVGATDKVTVSVADMAANTVKVRNANSSGVPSDIALATTEILIGDGTGFTNASLSGDTTMTNAGAVTIADNAVTLAKTAHGTQGGVQYYAASGVPSELAAGTSGYFLKTQGTSANPIWAEVAAGRTRRNLFWNGDMQVAQRNTSKTTITASDTYTVDRIYTQGSSFGTITQSQDAAAGINEFSYALKCDVTTADASPSAGDYIFLERRFEGFETQELRYGEGGAYTTTISFWVKSPKTGVHIVELRGDTSTRHIAKSYTVDSADTWEQKEISFAGDTSGSAALTNNNATGLGIRFWLMAGTTYSSGTLATSWAAVTNANTAVGQVNCMDSDANNFYITGIQFEIGSSKTDYEHLPKGDVLQLCKRYYHQCTGAEVSGNWFSDTVCNLSWNFPVEMRASPTITLLDSSPVVAQLGCCSKTGSGSSLSGHEVNPLGTAFSLDGFSGATAQEMAVLLNAGTPAVEANADIS